MGEPPPRRTPSAEHGGSRHRAPIREIAWKPNGARIVTTSEDATARVWDPSRAKLLMILAHDGPVWDAAWSPQGFRIATASDDGAARVWDSKEGVATCVFSHEKPVGHVEWHPGGRLLLSTSRDGTARIWDVERKVQLLRLDHGGTVWNAHWNRDASLVTTASGDGSVRIWDAYSGRLVHTLSHGAEVYRSRWSPNERFVATTSADRVVRIWDTTTGRLVHSLAHAGAVWHLGWSPNQKTLLTAADDRLAYVWDTRSGQLERTLEHHGGVRWTGWSRDGSRFLTAGDDGIVRIWEAADSRLVLELPHDAPVRRALWSPDETEIVTGSADGAVILWDARKGRAISTLGRSLKSPTPGATADSPLDVEPQPLTIYGESRAYRIKQTIGRGGTAVVYLASAGNRDYAIKVASTHRFRDEQALLRRLAREIEILRSLEHPHIIRIEEVLWNDGRPTLVMELAARGSLDKLLESGKGKPMDIGRSRAWMRELASALGAIHQAGIVHRDVTPKNVLIRDDWTLALADFGIARYEDDPTMTGDQDKLGSLIYISPHQRENPHRATPADDVFSLGQVYFYMLTGTHPHNVFDRVRECRPEVPAGLASLVDRMRSSRVNDRPSHGAAVLEGLTVLSEDT